MYDYHLRNLGDFEVFTLLVSVTVERSATHWCEKARSTMEDTVTSLIEGHGEDVYVKAVVENEKKTQKELKKRQRLDKGW